MRAAVCRAFGEPLVIEDLCLDPIGPHEVRVEVAACAICHSDIHYADGSWGGARPFATSSPCATPEVVQRSTMVWARD